jgi:hypothetical protein
MQGRKNDSTATPDLHGASPLDKAREKLIAGGNTWEGATGAGGAAPAPAPETPASAEPVADPPGPGSRSWAPVPLPPRAPNLARTAVMSPVVSAGGTKPMPEQDGGRGRPGIVRTFEAPAPAARVVGGTKVLSDQQEPASASDAADGDQEVARRLGLGPGTRLGQYEIIRELGQGGAGRSRSSSCKPAIWR